VLFHIAVMLATGAYYSAATELGRHPRVRLGALLVLMQHRSGVGANKSARYLELNPTKPTTR